MKDPNIEEIVDTVASFIEWIWTNGNYQIAFIGLTNADILTPNELLQLATRFAHDRAKAFKAKAT